VRALSVLLVVLLIAAPVQAQEGAPVPEGDVDVPTGPDVIVVAREGVAAPFTGQLFDQATALRWGNRLVRYRMRIHLLEEELNMTRAAYDASIAQRLDLQAQSYGREIDGLRTDLRDQATRYESELARYRNQPFWESWGFAFGMGALVVAIVVAVVGAAIFAH
jgi:hypothetical protein